VLGGVVSVDLDVAAGTDGEVHGPMARDLVQHVRQEGNGRDDIGAAGAIEVEGDLDAGLACGTGDAGSAGHRSRPYHAGVRGSKPATSTSFAYPRRSVATPGDAPTTHGSTGSMKDDAGTWAVGSVAAGVAVARRDPYRRAEGRDQRHEHQRARPGLVVPVL